MYVGCDLLNVFFQTSDVLFLPNYFDFVIVKSYCLDLPLQLPNVLLLFVDVALKAQQPQSKTRLTAGSSCPLLSVQGEKDLVDTERDEA